MPLSFLLCSLRFLLFNHILVSGDWSLRLHGANERYEKHPCRSIILPRNNFWRCPEHGSERINAKFRIGVRLSEAKPRVLFEPSFGCSWNRADAPSNLIVTRRTVRNAFRMMSALTLGNMVALGTFQLTKCEPVCRSIMRNATVT